VSKNLQKNATSIIKEYNVATGESKAIQTNIRKRGIHRKKPTSLKFLVAILKKEKKEKMIYLLSR